MNILILGCGKLGFKLAHQLLEQGHQITTVSRSPKTMAKGITHLSQDITQLDLSQLQQKFDWVYVILSPSEHSLAGYQATYLDTILPISQSLKSHPIQKIFYISSTRVYGENAGKMIDDQSPIQPSDDFGKCLYQAEQLWQKQWADKLTIIRPSGLVDALSPRLQSLAHQMSSISEHHWSNLVLRDDVIRFLVGLTQHQPKTLQAHYILNGQTLLRSSLLNAIRTKLNLPQIVLHQEIVQHTGKQLKASNALALGFQFQSPLEHLLK